MYNGLHVHYTSNFIVYSRWGDLEVNTILGDWGVEEYVYTFNEGDEVEAHSSFKMQPIEWKNKVLNLILRPFKIKRIYLYSLNLS